MQINAVRPTRAQVLVAFAGVLCILGLTAVQCGLLAGENYAPHQPHASAAAGQLSPDDVVAQHAHVDDGSSHIGHETQVLASLPRTDNPLRLLGVIAAVVTAAAVTVLTLRTRSRGPPGTLVSARTGRTVLNDLCINRC